MTKDRTLEEKCIVCRVKEEAYIIPVQSIGSIERMVPTTRVPAVPSFVKGVMNLRGIIIPVIDMKERLFFEKTAETEQTRIIIIHLTAVTVGLIVESASDVVDVSGEHLEETAEVTGAAKANYVQGIVHINETIYIQLDLEQILAHDTWPAERELEVQHHG